MMKNRDRLATLARDIRLAEADPGKARQYLDTAIQDMLANGADKEDLKQSLVETVDFFAGRPEPVVEIFVADLRSRGF